MDPTPTLELLQETAHRLEPLVLRTPVWRWGGAVRDRVFPSGIRVDLKLELLQHTGSFKARGALTTMLRLDPDRLRRGVTAVSAGNHAAAVGFAAKQLGTTAKVVMPRTANPARVALCRAYGAEVVLTPDVHVAFAEVERLEREEGRTAIHPFEGLAVALGTGTLGLELVEQAADLDAVVVPVGGGGLAGGLAAAVKLSAPQVAVFGVEPVGADSMSRSFRAGAPEPAGPITTIADSLAPPYSLPYSFALCRQYLDDLVTVDDDALCESLYWLFLGAKLAVEPAGAAGTAAVLGPLRDRLAGRRVGIIVCGANIDEETYATCLRRGAEVARHRGPDA